MRSAEPNGEKDIPPQPGGEERRGDRRHLSILRVGKLIADDIQELCVVRNISSGGLKARVYSDKTVGQRVAVELKSGQEMAGTVQWAVGNEIGIQFDEKIDVPALLASDEVVTRGQKPRPPRVRIPTLAMLRLRSELVGIGIEDISQGGAKIEIDQPLRIGDEVVIMVGEFRPLTATVRWVRGGSAGVEFKQMIPYTELATWLSSITREGVTAR